MPRACTTGTAATTSRASSPDRGPADPARHLPIGLTESPVLRGEPDGPGARRTAGDGTRRTRSGAGRPSRNAGGPAPLVTFVHGIAGVGKSALVGPSRARRVSGRDRRFASIAARSSRPSAGSWPPSRASIGGELRTSPDAAARLAELGDRVVLVLDRYEVLRPLDPWLRPTFLPALGDNVRIVLAGREPPMADWPRRMGACSGSPARQSATRGRRAPPSPGRDPRRQTPTGSIGSHAGHPLSLRLAAAAVVDYPGIDREASTVNAMVEALTELYLARLDPRLARCSTRRQLCADPTISASWRRCCRMPRPRMHSSGCGACRSSSSAPTGWSFTTRFVTSLRPILRSSDPDRSGRIGSRPGDSSGTRWLEPAARDVAVHRRPAVHPREPAAARGVLPDDRAPVLRRGSPARGWAGNRRDPATPRATRVGWPSSGSGGGGSARVPGGAGRRGAVVGSRSSPRWTGSPEPARR